MCWSFTSRHKCAKGSSQLPLHQIKLPLFKANGHRPCGSLLSLEPICSWDPRPQRGTPRVLCMRPPAACTMMQVTVCIRGIMWPFVLDWQLESAALKLWTGRHPPLKGNTHSLYRITDSGYWQFLTRKRKYSQDSLWRPSHTLHNNSLLIPGLRLKAVTWHYDLSAAVLAPEEHFPFHPSSF